MYKKDKRENEVYCIAYFKLKTMRVGTLILGDRGVR